MSENNEMKIVQINTLGATLSTGRTTREMHNYFINHNITSNIVCPAPLDCDDAFFFSSRFEMRMDTLMTMATGLEAHHSKRQTKKLLHYLARIKPDIVHLRVLHSNCINLPMLMNFLIEQDIATVITLHDFWFLTGKCCFYSNLNCNKWITGCHHCPLPQNKLRPMLFDRSKQMWIDKIKGLSSIPRLALVGVSNWVTDEAKKSPISSKCTLKRIYNWIDLKTFYPHETINLRENYKLEEKFIILGVSAAWQLNDRKGFESYLELSKLLPIDCTIMLIGKMNFDGELPMNLISVGSINEKERLSDFYSMSNVYLNLSSEETFGKVSAEALACGTPVIAIDATVNRELVPPECGVVVKNRDVRSILTAVINVKENGKRMYSDYCRSFAEQNFSLEKNIEEYLELYRILIKSKK